VTAVPTPTNANFSVLVPARKRRGQGVSSRLARPPGLFKSPPLPARSAYRGLSGPQNWRMSRQSEWGDREGDGDRKIKRRSPLGAKRPWALGKV
jgi:hypothetical protein